MDLATEIPATMECTICKFDVDISRMYYTYNFAKDGFSCRNALCLDCSLTLVEKTEFVTSREDYRHPACPFCRSPINRLHPAVPGKVYSVKMESGWDRLKNCQRFKPETDTIGWSMGVDIEGFKLIADRSVHDENAFVKMLDDIRSRRRSENIVVLIDLVDEEDGAEGGSSALEAGGTVGELPSNINTCSEAHHSLDHTDQGSFNPEKTRICCIHQGEIKTGRGYRPYGRPPSDNCTYITMKDGSIKKVDPDDALDDDSFEAKVCPHQACLECFKSHLRVTRVESQASQDSPGWVTLYDRRVPRCPICRCSIKLLYPVFAGEIFSVNIQFSEDRYHDGQKDTVEIKPIGHSRGVGLKSVQPPPSRNLIRKSDQRRSKRGPVVVVDLVSEDEDFREVYPNTRGERDSRHDEGDVGPGDPHPEGEEGVGRGPLRKRGRYS